MVFRVVAVLAVILAGALASAATTDTTNKAEGITALKLDDSSTNLVREARKALTVVNKEISDVNHQILLTRAQTTSYRGAPGSNDNPQIPALQAHQVALEQQRSELVRQRSQLLSIIAQ